MAPLASHRVGGRALSGALAAGVALGAGELLAGVFPGLPSLLDAVGGRVIDAAPPALKDTAIGALGTADKPALLIGIVVIAAVLGALLAARTPRLVLPGFGVFALLGILAAGGGLGAVLVGILAAGAGGGAFWYLGRPRPGADPASGPLSSPAPESPGRRELFRRAGGLGLAAIAAGTGGRALHSRQAVNVAREGVALPAPARSLPPLPAGADLATRHGIRGLARLFTPNARFYRIDTALTVPRVDPATWRLRVAGLVDRERTWTLDELLAMPLVEADVTIACVSNEVGGGLVGSARWLGVPLRDLLEAAGPLPEAAQVIGHSVDGFTAGFPVEAAFDEDRTALVVVGMNGEPLPARHGFPARLVVEGLYGYVSATKWLDRIELTTWDVDGYWIPRGWAKEAPIKTQSRIDVPQAGARLAPGPGVIAGVAWAPGRGIAGVEARVDDGPWRPATLSPALGDGLWRQWVLDWEAAPGRHEITVRATDGTGATQTAQVQPPRPDGATGWHTVTVDVSV
jgi:DMSO/TMAO reductase YedYZ molybdopterin-dependent catalytic subunit